MRIIIIIACRRPTTTMINNHNNDNISIDLNWKYIYIIGPIFNFRYLCLFAAAKQTY